MNQDSQISDIDLVEQIKEGDDSAFRLFFDRYAKRLYNFSIYYLKSKPDAEEMVQDVFVKFWNNREQLNSGGNIKAYLFRVAVNTAYDIVKKKKQEGLDIDIIANTIFKNDTWDEVLYQDLQNRHDRLIDEMPEKRKEIYFLSRKKGLSNKEIAEELNISVRTVESQIYKAISFLKHHLFENTLINAIFFYLFVM